MSRSRQKVRAEEDGIRIRMYLCFGGFHYRTIAKMVDGRAWTLADVTHVGKIAREWGMSSRDWRNGLTDDSKRYLKSVEASPRVKKAMQSTVAGDALPLKLAVGN